MIYRNISDSFKTFSIPMPNGSVRWYSAEPNGLIDIPESEGHRAIAFGFQKVEAKKIIPVIPIKPVIKKKPR